MKKQMRYGTGFFQASCRLVLRGTTAKRRLAMKRQVPQASLRSRSTLPSISCGKRKASVECGSKPSTMSASMFPAFPRFRHHDSDTFPDSSLGTGVVGVAAARRDRRRPRVPDAVARGLDARGVAGLYNQLAPLLCARLAVLFTFSSPWPESPWRVRGRAVVAPSSQASWLRWRGDRNRFEACRIALRNWWSLLRRRAIFFNYVLLLLLVKKYPRFGSGSTMFLQPTSRYLFIRDCINDR